MGRVVLIASMYSTAAAGPFEQHVIREALAELMSQGKSALNSISLSPDIFTDGLGQSTMELDHSIRSDYEPANNFGTSFGISRNEIPFPVTPAVQSSMEWLCIRLENDFRLIGGTTNEFVDSTLLFDFLANLEITDLLAVHPAVVHTVKQCSTVGRTEACGLLEKVAKACLQEYTLERSEVALCCCLELMESLAYLWATDETDDLNATAYDMYSWFVQVALGKSIASDRTVIRIAHMLGRVLAVNANFARDEAEPSPRTHLFELLQSGSNVVRYYSVPAVLEIFGHFVLSEHDKIFDDVIEHLPTDPSYLEGIALRLFVLTELACRWRTLLRRSIYHLFEAPGLIPECTNHARHCVKKLAEVLEVQESRRVFTLFAPQILYTWLQNQDTTSIPFRVFAYDRLRDLLTDVL